MEYHATVLHVQAASVLPPMNLKHVAIIHRSEIICIVMHAIGLVMGSQHRYSLYLALFQP